MLRLVVFGGCAAVAVTIVATLTRALLGRERYYKLYMKLPIFKDKIAAGYDVSKIKPY
jgi:hypothetical protein